MNILCEFLLHEFAEFFEIDKPIIILVHRFEVLLHFIFSDVVADSHEKVEEFIAIDIVWIVGVYLIKQLFQMRFSLLHYSAYIFSSSAILIKVLLEFNITQHPIFVLIHSMEQVA